MWNTDCLGKHLLSSLQSKWRNRLWLVVDAIASWPACLVRRNRLPAGRSLLAVSLTCFSISWPWGYLRILEGVWQDPVPASHKGPLPSFPHINKHLNTSIRQTAGSLICREVPTGELKCWNWVHPKTGCKTLVHYGPITHTVKLKDGIPEAGHLKTQLEAPSTNKQKQVCPFPVEIGD